MNLSFSFYKYSSVATTVIWTLSWVLASCVAAEFLMQTYSAAAWFNVILTAAITIFGCRHTYRIYPRNGCSQTAKKYPREPWVQRVFGWIGVLVWCGVGLIWNWAVLGCLVRAASKGQSILLLILIPFSVIGWFLLLVFFVCVSVSLDSLLKIGDSAPSMSPMEEPIREAPAPMSTAIARPTEPSLSAPVTSSNKAASEDFFKKSPILGALLLLSVVNWFVFAGISIYLGGDAVGVLPSRDGFVLTSHGHHTPVSESVWVFSLFYSSATLLLTPLIWLVFAVRQFGLQWMKSKRRLKWFIPAFLLAWVLGWYSGVGGSFYHSLKDWQNLKHSTAPAQPLRQTPTVPRDTQK